MTRSGFIKILRKGKKHKDPDITFWLGESKLELESMGEFGVTQEMAITFKKIENPPLLETPRLTKKATKIMNRIIERIKKDIG